MISKNPLVVNNIIKYNNIIENISTTYDFIHFVNALDSRNSNIEIYEDGYHPNPYGNEIVYHYVKEILELIND